MVEKSEKYSVMVYGLTGWGKSTFLNHLTQTREELKSKPNFWMGERTT